MEHIESAQVRGLRASGTNYLASLMVGNFPELHVAPSLIGAGHDDYGWKHGTLGSEAREYIDGVYLEAQKTFYVRYEDGKEAYRVRHDDTDFVDVDPEGDVYIRNRVHPVTDSTLLVVVHRNPLKWLQSLHQQPHHTPTHYGLNMAEFIRAPWLTCYTSPNADCSPDENVRQHWIEKSKRLGEIVIEDEVSVFAHRARSIKLFETLQNEAPHVVYLNYEQLRNHPQVMLGRLALQFDISVERKFKEAKTYKGNGIVPYIEKPYPPFTKSDLLYIMQAIDWDAERIIGYNQVRDFSAVTDPEEIPDEACANPASLLTFNPRLRMYSLIQAVA